MGGCPYGARTFGQYPRRGGTGESDDDTEQYRFRLVPRQFGDQRECLPGRDGFEGLVLGVVGAGKFEQVLLEGGRAGPGFLPAQMVERAVAGDGRRPGPETGPVTAEAPQIPGYLQPRVGRHILRLVPDEPTHVTEQPRLHLTVRDSESGLIALLGTRDRRAQFLVVLVGAAALACLVQSFPIRAGTAQAPAPLPFTINSVREHRDVAGSPSKPARSARGGQRYAGWAGAVKHSRADARSSYRRSSSRASSGAAPRTSASTSAPPSRAPVAMRSGRKPGAMT